MESEPQEGKKEETVESLWKKYQDIQAHIDALDKAIIEYDTLTYRILELLEQREYYAEKTAQERESYKERGDTDIDFGNHNKEGVFTSLGVGTIRGMDSLNKKKDRIFITKNDFYSAVKMLEDLQEEKEKVRNLLIQSGVPAEELM